MVTTMGLVERIGDESREKTLDLLNSGDRKLEEGFIGVRRIVAGFR